MLRRKVAKAYFSLIEVLCHNHTGTVACQDSGTFGFILSSLDQVGLAKPCVVFKVRGLGYRYEDCVLARM
jgi:hypothetical protein